MTNRQFSPSFDVQHCKAFDWLVFPASALTAIIRSLMLLSVSSSEQEVDRMLHAIADPTRRHILQALKERGGCSLGKDVGLCASDVEARVQLSQSTVSHHMAILTKAGLVNATKLGLWRWYRRDETAIRELVRALREHL
jgi:DNA-binding transcriptional ArsR family regulator